MIAATLSVDPKKRPSIFRILKMPLIKNRIKRVLNERISTTLHNKKMGMRMRQEDGKQVMNEVQFPSSELRMQLLQGKNQENYLSAIKKEKQEKQKMESNERERLEQEHKEK